MLPGRLLYLKTEANMKPNPTITSLRAGQTLYYVHHLGPKSFIFTYLLTSRATVSPCIYSFDGFITCYGRMRLDDRRLSAHASEFSLTDANIVPNRYNKHRAFYSRKRAQTYLKKCCSEPNPLRSSDYQQQFTPAHTLQTIR